MSSWSSTHSQQAAKQVVKILNQYKGFDYWWGDVLDAKTDKEIMAELEASFNSLAKKTELEHKNKSERKFDSECDSESESE